MLHNEKKLLKKKKVYNSTVDYLNTTVKKNRGMSDTEFKNIIIKELLGDGWCVTDPMHEEAVTVEALCEILERFSPKMKDKGFNKGGRIW